MKYTPTKGMAVPPETKNSELAYLKGRISKFRESMGSRDEPFKAPYYGDEHKKDVKYNSNLVKELQYLLKRLPNEVSEDEELSSRFSDINLLQTELLLKYEEYETIARNPSEYIKSRNIPKEVWYDFYCRDHLLDDKINKWEEVKLFAPELIPAIIDQSKELYHLISNFLDVSESLLEIHFSRKTG